LNVFVDNSLFIMGRDFSYQVFDSLETAQNFVNGENHDMTDIDEFRNYFPVCDLVIVSHNDLKEMVMTECATNTSTDWKIVLVYAHLIVYTPEHSFIVMSSC